MSFQCIPSDKHFAWQYPLTKTWKYYLLYKIPVIYETSTIKKESYISMPELLL